MSNKITVYEFDTTNRMHPFLDAAQIDANIGLKDNQTTVAPNEAQFFNGHEWVNELTNAYHYDEKGYFDAVAIIPKGSELKTNETLVVPYDNEGRGMYKPKFDMAQNTWIETLTQTEIDALNQPAAPKPTAEQQTISLLGQRVAQTTAENAQIKQDNVQLKQMVSAIGQTVAQLKAQSTITTDTTTN